MALLDKGMPVLNVDIFFSNLFHKYPLIVKYLGI